MLHELVPTVNLFALLVNPNNRPLAEADTRQAQVAARLLGVSLLVLDARSPSEIDEAFATLIQERAGALLTNGDTYFMTQRIQLAALAARHAVPAIYTFPENVLAGGLMSYGTNILDTSRQLGVYTGRIRKARSHPTCLCSRSPNSNWSSISKPQERSVSRFQTVYWPLPIE